MEPTEKDAALKAPETQKLSRAERFSLDLNRVNAAIEVMLSDVATDSADLKEAWTVRAVLAENFVDSLEPTLDNPNPRPRAQFDIMVDKAHLFEKAGNLLRYLEELDAAEALAYNEHLDDVTVSLSEEIDEKTKELGTSPEELVMKLRGYIDFANREYLRDLLIEGADYDDFLGDVYGMIFDEGGDPDEVFATLGITE